MANERDMLDEELDMGPTIGDLPGLPPTELDVARAGVRSMAESAQLDLVQQAENSALIPTPETGAVDAISTGAPLGYPTDISVATPPLTVVPDNGSLGFGRPSTDPNAGILDSWSLGEDQAVALNDQLAPMNKVGAAALGRQAPGVMTEYPTPTTPSGQELLVGADVPIAPAKIGEQRITPHTPELDAAQAQTQDLLQRNQAITDAAVVAEAELSAAARPLDDARVKVTGDYAKQIRLDAANARNAYAAARQDVENIRKEMASQDWGSYWGSKDTGDKLMLALSVGLGAYSQSQIGGQNVALQVINSMIEDHRNTRTSKFNALRDRLQASSQDGLAILEGADRLNKLEAASTLADMDVIKAQYDVMANRTSSLRLQNKIKQENIAVGLKAAEETSRIESQLAIQNSRTQDLFSGPKTASIDPASYKTLNDKGQVVPMSDAQSKFNSTAIRQLQSEKAMRELEDTGVLQDPRYAAAYDTVTNTLKGMTGEILTNVQAMGRLHTALDDATLGNPGLREYFMQMINLTQLQTRQETGAAMAASELERNLGLVAPAPLHVTGSVEAQQEFLKLRRRERESWVRGNLGAAGNKSTPYFDQPLSKAKK